MNIETNLNLHEIDYRLAEIQNKRRRLIILPLSNRIIYTKLIEDKIILSNLSFKATGRVNTIEKKIHINLKLTIYWKIAGIITILLLFIAVFSNKVTINGNSNPLEFEKIIYLCFGLLFLSFPILLLLKQKSDFEQVIKQAFEQK